MGIFLWFDVAWTHATTGQEQTGGKVASEMNG
jgi:hypothetical protein